MNHYSSAEQIVKLTLLQEKTKGKVHEFGLAGSRLRLLTKDSKEPQHVAVFHKFKKFKFETKHPQGSSF